MLNGVHFYETLSPYWMGIIAGVLLITKHAWALIKKEQAIVLLEKFPRNDKLGKILLWMSMGWFWFMCLPNSPVKISFSDFEILRNSFIIGLPLLTFYLQIAIKDFLAIRFSGFIAILWAWPLLKSIFLKYPTLHWLMPIYGFLLIGVGVFAVGKPYLIRNLITWMINKDHPVRYQIACWSGLIYGIAMLTAALLYWNI